MTSSDDRKEFLHEYVSFFEKEIRITQDGKIEGKCSGELIITKTFALGRLTNPNEFLNNLTILGVNCDCRFLHALPMLMIKETGYGFNNVEKIAGGAWFVDWPMLGFKTALEAMSNQAIGIKIVGAGYFPPDSTVELVLHETWTLSILVIKESYNLVQKEELFHGS